jgi:hypothetical protein
MEVLTEVNTELKRFHGLNSEAVILHEDLLNKERDVKSEIEKLDKL